MNRLLRVMMLGILVAGCNKPGGTATDRKAVAEPASPAESPRPVPEETKPRDTLAEKYDPRVPVPAQQLVSEYERDPQAAYQKYRADKAIERIVVEGTVKELGQWESGAMQGVTVVFASKGRLSVHARMARDEKIELKPGDAVRIEGIMQGTGLWAGDENKILLASGKLVKNK
jgi:hypothetical protein